MPLSSGQLQTLKTAILANPVWNAQPNTPDGNDAIAKMLNAKAVPDYTVWKTNVSMVEVGRNINGTELAGLTTGDNTRLQTITMICGGFINPSLADQRSFFDLVFSGAGGQITRTQLAILWKKLATEGQKLYASGAGTNATPSTMGYEDPITYQEVGEARNLP